MPVSLTRILTPCGILLWLGACTVRLVPAYDARIDQDLTGLNTDLTIFVETMISEAKTPKGEYENNKGFYIAAQAKLATIQLREEAYRALGKCPSTEMVRSAVVRFIPSTPSAGAFPSALTPATVLAQLPRDDCEIGLLSLVSGGFRDLQRFHQAQGSLGIPASAEGPILVGGVGSLLRSAIAVEISKKSDKSLGSDKNGS